MERQREGPRGSSGCLECGSSLSGNAPGESQERPGGRRELCAGGVPLSTQVGLAWQDREGEEREDGVGGLECTVSGQNHRSGQGQRRRGKGLTVDSEGTGGRPVHTQSVGPLARIGA